ncbi:MAG: ribosome silencing factor [Aureliella sp.]
MQNDVQTNVGGQGLASHVSEEQRNESLRMARAAVKAAAENRGQNITVIDLTQQTSMFDFFVIVTGTSRRQLHAIASEIDRVLRKEMHESRLGLAGYDESRWIVLDYGSIVVHLFDEETRTFYDLESLWADGKLIDVSDIVANASAQMTRFSQ